MVAKKSWKELDIGGDLPAAASAGFMTGDWRSSRPVVDLKKCIHCMQCVCFCPDDCIKHKEGKRGKTDLGFCKGCGICEKVCPVKCIKMEKERVAP